MSVEKKFGMLEKKFIKGGTEKGLVEIPSDLRENDELTRVRRSNYINRYISEELITDNVSSVKVKYGNSTYKVTVK
jgi:hypothetical protein